jgi:lysophospholipase L1-like esterase
VLNHALRALYRAWTRIKEEHVRLSSLAIVCCGVILIGCRSRPLDVNGDGVVTVLCVGDSNTDPKVKADGPKWCELLAGEYAGRPEWKFVNGGVGRAKAAGDGFFCGRTMLRAALAAVPADIVILALGTNDMQSPPEVAVDALLSLNDQAASAKAQVLIATIPPVYYGNEEVSARIVAANALLAQKVAADRLVDFHSGMNKEDFHPDGLHINLSGQRKRAAAAHRALKNL